MTKKKNKRIYLDWNDYWRNGNHGHTSHYQKYAKEIWDDFEPTINANRSDLDRQVLEINKEREEYKLKFDRRFLEYLDEFKVEEYTGVKFFRWFLDKERKEREEKNEQEKVRRK